jgi:UDP-2-acetamido-3-amino-2,3-dideoxy-glucuronate N-acetyltransferase
MEQYWAHETAIIDKGCFIGDGTKIWHFCHVLTGSIIGNNCIFGQNVMIGPNVEIGDRVKIQNNVSVYAGVQLDEDVFVGPSAVFTNVINPRSFVDRKDEFRTTFVGKGATIGANATIICGADIGKFAMIGAGSVVTKSVAPFSLVVGNPAQHIGWVSKNGHRLYFNDGWAICQETGEQYVFNEDGVEVMVFGS